MIIFLIFKKIIIIFYFALQVLYLHY